VKRVTVEIEGKKVYLTLTEAHERLLGLRCQEPVDALHERLDTSVAAGSGTSVEDRATPVLD
jgi:hypothetical protein